MCAPRFKARGQSRLYRALCGAVLLLCAPLRAQTITAPRVGEVAPPLDCLGEGGKRVTTGDFVGKRSQFWIVQNKQPEVKADDAVAKAAQGVVARGIALLLIGPSSVTSWPSPFQTLLDGQNTITTRFDAPTFVAVDRAGWVRDVETLPQTADDPQAFALRFLLERSPDPTPAFEVGKAAPDFCVPDANGLWRRLSSLRGRKNLVLTFFPRCFTGKCKSHLSSLRDSFGAFQLADTEVWAVSVDAAEGEKGQKAFAQSLQLPFPMLPDEGRNLCFLYGAAQTTTDLAKRQTVLIDKDGIVRFVDREVAPDTHGDDILAHLKELGMMP